MFIVGQQFQLIVFIFTIRSLHKTVLATIITTFNTVPYSGNILWKDIMQFCAQTNISRINFAICGIDSICLCVDSNDSRVNFHELYQIAKMRIFPAIR